MAEHLITIREVEDQDWPWILAASKALGGPRMVSGGFVYDLADYPAYVAMDGDEPAGFIVYRVGGLRVYILGILSIVPRKGVGSKMLDALEKRSQDEGKTQIRLSATNDNLPALRFCQLRGYRLRQLIPDAFDAAKKLKGIPEDQVVIGVYGIETRDEIILNKDL